MMTGTALMPSARLSDGLGLAQRSVDFAQACTGVVMTAAGRAQLVDVVVGAVAQLEEWAADPLGGPPDPWTYLRRRWHRQARLRWWGAVPAATRRMVTGLAPYGRDSLMQLAWSGSVPLAPAVVSRWRTGLLDFDPSSDAGAANRLARRRASRRCARSEPWVTAMSQPCGMIPNGG
jgi:hypothetical protein